MQVLFAEEFGDETYISIVKDFIDAVKGYPHTPLGLVIINEWGTLRHAMNEAFLAFKVTNLKRKSLKFFLQKRVCTFLMFFFLLP